MVSFSNGVAKRAITELAYIASKMIAGGKLSEILTIKFRRNAISLAVNITYDVAPTGIATKMLSVSLRVLTQLQ